MIFAATFVLLLSAFAAAQDEPAARCRQPKELKESAKEGLEAAFTACDFKGIRGESEVCDRVICLCHFLDLVDDDLNVKPQEVADFFLPEEGYEETNEYFVETFTHCVETGEGESLERCDFLKPLACVKTKFMQECGSY